jgi:phosphate starvation-inducible PhoH-like protein
MSEATITSIEPRFVLPLFGTRDQHLRRLRERFQVDITHRDGEIRVSGPDESVAQATQVLEQLSNLVRQQGTLSSDQLDEAVARVTGDSPPATAHRVDVMQAGQDIRARTPGQAGYVEAMRQSPMVVATGPAGSGKTYLAVAMAVEALKHQAVRKIVLVRPAVEAGENLGFLPGDLNAKINPYLRPLLDAIYEMVGFDQVQRLVQQDVIEVIPLAYMRGRTLNEAFIILDEAQNTTVAQMKMFLTRMGQKSKVIVSGDITQVDLPLGTRSGLDDAIHRLAGIPGIQIVELTKADIVRHRLVQAILDAYDREGRGQPPADRRNAPRRGRGWTAPPGRDRRR